MSEFWVVVTLSLHSEKTKHSQNIEMKLCALVVRFGQSGDTKSKKPENRE